MCSVFTAFSFSKDFELEDELNWLMGQMHAEDLLDDTQNQGPF